MFHQPIFPSLEDTPLFDSVRNLTLIEHNQDVISNEFDVGFDPGSRLGFLFQNFDNPFTHDLDDSSQAPESDIISVLDEDCWDAFHIQHNNNNINDIAPPNPNPNPIPNCDCDEEESSFHLSWDSFHIQDSNNNNNNNNVSPPNFNSNSNANANANLNSHSNAYANEDFEWEEVDNDDRIEEREALSMFFGDEPDDDASVSPVLLTGFRQVNEPREQEQDALEWQVLSNVTNFGPDIDSEDQYDQYDEYTYTEYEMFFGQFGESDAGYSGRPPASKSAVVNLLTVVMSQEDVVNNNVICAVCKDEVVVGEKATQLPCSHRYHGDCILPWLAVRNTCPVCRYELPTDDPDYERRRAERGGG